jgi:hypothetical protein
VIVVKEAAMVIEEGLLLHESPLLHLCQLQQLLRKTFGLHPGNFMNHQPSFAL